MDKMDHNAHSVYLMYYHLIMVVKYELLIGFTEHEFFIVFSEHELHELNE